VHSEECVYFKDNHVCHFWDLNARVHREDRRAQAAFGARPHGTPSNAPENRLMHRGMLSPEVLARSCGRWAGISAGTGRNVAPDTLLMGVEAHVSEEVQRCAFLDWCWQEDLLRPRRCRLTPFRWGRTRSDLRQLQLPASSRRGMAVVGAGIRCPDIGASGEGDGFRRIVRRTATTGAGTLMRVGKAPLKDGVITAAGEARKGVGVGPTAHNL